MKLNAGGEQRLECVDSMDERLWMVTFSCQTSKSPMWWVDVKPVGDEGRKNGNVTLHKP